MPSETLPRKITDDMLRCKICLGRYNTKEMLPRTLGCQHTFSERCIRDSLLGKGTKYANEIKCPLCKQITVVGKSGVKDIPVNGTIVDIISLVDREVSKCSTAQCSSGTRRSQECCKDVKKQATSKPSPFRVEMNRNGSSGGIVVMSAAPTRNSMASPPVNIPDVKDDEDVDDDDAVTPLSILRLHPPPIRPGGSNKNSLDQTISYQFDADGDPNFSSAAVDFDDTESYVPTNDSASSPGEFDSEQRGGSDGRNFTGGAQIVYPMSELYSMAPEFDLSSAYPGDPMNNNNSYFEPVVVIQDDAAQSLHAMPHRSTSPSNTTLSLATTAKYIGRFGKYSENRTEPGAFQSPTKIACSPHRGHVVVVDTVNMTVQTFTHNGDCLSMFTVGGVSGACFVNDELLALGTSRGAELVTTKGRQDKIIPIGPVIAVASYRTGVVAAQRDRLSVCKGVTKSTTIHTISGTRFFSDGPGRPRLFVNIVDLCVNGREEICVLDTAAGVQIIDEEGVVKSTVSPGRDAVCGPLQNPVAVCVDEVDNVVIADAGSNRVLMFDKTGRFLRCLVDLETTTPPVMVGERGGATVCGIGVNRSAISKNGQLFVVLGGGGVAEVRIYRL